VQETDLAGHSQDSNWYRQLLEISDEKIEKMLPMLGDEDILLVMADHGNDPNIGHNKHTRENVPLLVLVTATVWQFAPEARSTLTNATLLRSILRNVLVAVFVSVLVPTTSSTLFPIQSRP
jgi:phosphopentomutase